MYYFLGMIIIALFIGANMRYGKRSVRKIKKNTLTIEWFVLFAMFIIYVLIFALESVQSNSDMQNYREAYFSFQFVSSDIWLSKLLEGKDPVYYFMNYVFCKMGFGFYTWHAFIGLFYSYAIYTLLKRYSSNIYISFIASISLGSFSFALSALRQMIAISFIMFAFRYIEEKKILKFILLTLIATLFHSTAIVFLIAYPLYRIKLKIRTLFVMVIGMVMVVPMARPIVEFILPRIGANELYYGYLQSEKSLSFSGTIISILILLFCVVFILKDSKSAKYHGLCNFAMVSIFFRLLSVFFFAEMFRLSLYFSIFDTIMIAEACSCGNSKDKTLIRIKTVIATFGMMVYYFISPAVNILDYVLR